MIRRSTWFLMVILAGLVVLTWYVRQPKNESEATPTSPVNYLFTSEDGILTALKIESNDDLKVAVERGSDGTWVMKLPDSVKANQGTVEAAATQISALRILNTLESTPSGIGLNPPTYIITIQFSSGKQYILLVGDSTPTSSGYYVQREDKSLIIVDKDGLDAVLNLLSAPPYEETPTPSPTMVPTVIASIETGVPIASETPIPTP